MIQSLQQFARYEAYQDSGVEWLGDIPQGWQLIPLKRILSFHTGGTPSSGEAKFYNGNLPWVTISDLNGRHTSKHHTISKSGVRDARIPLTVKGSLLYSFKLSIGQVSFASTDIYTNEAIASFTPQKKINLNYCFYSLPLFIEQNAVLNIYGAKILNQQLIKNAVILKISTEEQTAIANFLDQKTAEIDQAIALKADLIERLKEYKQITIQHAVTRGLDPNAKMRASGVEWIGDIPEGWQLLTNKSIFKLKKNLVGKRSSEYVLLSLTLKGLIKRDMENPEGKFPAEFDTYQEVKKGDFVFCLFDVEETPRTVGLSSFDGMITGAYTVFQPLEGYNPHFLYYFYLNLDTKKRLRPLYKGLRNTIPKDSFMSIKTFVPPLAEQAAIVAHIEAISAKIDQATDQAQQQINTLTEYKTVLINAAVTGKIKVTDDSAQGTRHAK